MLREGLQVIVEDDFTKCFQRPRLHSWNWTVYLFPVWLLGLFMRYCILFPLRLVILIGGCLIFAIYFAVVSMIKNKDKREHWQR
jgi:glycerol-3-phosphate O-acyltransferase 3/4